MKPWILLAFAILCEVAGTTSMKLSEGFTKLVPSILLFVLYGVSFVLLTLALKKIDLSTAYAIWAGAGTALVAVIGFYFFSEPPTLLRISCILLIVLGVVGLKLAPA
jgi:small multidrug resistance pump